MGGKRYMQIHLHHLYELGDNHHAELYYEYLVQCDRFLPKDNAGFFELSTSSVFKVVRLKRHVQSNARALLAEKGWIECKTEKFKTKFKVLK